jgi:hypothetical protein
VSSKLADDPFGRKIVVSTTPGDAGRRWVVVGNNLPVAAHGVSWLGARPRTVTPTVRDEGHTHSVMPPR